MDNKEVTYPIITPDLEGSRYCVSCLWNGACHPEREDDRIFILRYGPGPLDTKSFCEPHLINAKRRYGME